MTATPDQAAAGIDFVPAAGRVGFTRLYDAVIAISARERKLRATLFAAVEAAVEGIDEPRIVEIGCGTGSVAIPLAQRLPHASVIAVDIDREALAIAKSKPGSDAVEWIAGTATDPPVVAGGADVVITSLVLHHLSPSNQKAALAAARTALKKDGTVHVVDWGVPRGILPRAGFPLLQLIDGRENTDPMGSGLLPELILDAGFSELQRLHRIGTVWGSLEQYCAVRRDAA